ncbi:glycine cleavage system protein R [Litorilituus sediminis]|uniref:Glycine cleavage system transcriptional repressor n=1 Tax=Litorilituus sediminis TaxID=718192 RepID=A0A4P6P199_9GAMM|nr:ACT domain-containing protein [Litorilituus sediminis]QBG34783.1 transcriptional regulator [Litorilituus sediminis]
MSQYLVLTAMGADRTGCVSELTKLASECECNILDSRMAIFGSEFTFIMLLNGDARAINKIEGRIPAVAHSLDLITMMKRTTGHRTFDLVHHYQADYAGIDQPGILKAMTAFFATRKIDISSLKSEIDPENNHMKASILFALTDKISFDDLEHDFLELCQQTDVQGCIKKATANLL